MNYHYQQHTKTTAVIQLIPESEQEQKLLASLEMHNPDQEMTIYHNYDQGLHKGNPSAVLLGIDDFISFPTKATVKFEVVIGLG